ncbi:Protein MAIN-LIKE 2 [Linum grandiflorum]
MEMCTTLIERWRLETNTFHIYHDEMTITLEDVTFITSLPVNGAPVFNQYEEMNYTISVPVTGWLLGLDRTTRLEPSIFATN